MIYNLKQEELISFFQIGGIHGLPYIAWDGAGADDPAEASGYCTHGSVLFPTWHRPYVALFEVRKCCTYAGIYVDTMYYAASSAELCKGYCEDVQN